MPSFAIKQASLNDISIIIALQEKIWFPTYLPILSHEQVDYMFRLMYTPDAITHQIENLKHTFLLLYEDNTAVGFASYSNQEKYGFFKIHKIYILPERQGTGAGKHLLSAVLNECVEKGAAEVRLNVNRFNKARFFYEKMGFEVLYEDDIAVGPYFMNDYIMAFNPGLSTI